MTERRGVMLVLSAPSGAGKTTVAQRLLAREPAVQVSVSATTRAPRPGEVDGQHYHFVSSERFAAMVAAGEMLEHATVFGRSYGTPRAPVEAALAAGRDVLFDIDWQGHRQLLAAAPADVVGVFLLPPSLQALEDRLTGRNQDSPEEVARRMSQAAAEVSHWRDYSHVVVNNDLEEAVAAVAHILHGERHRRSRAQAAAALAEELTAGLAPSGAQ